VIEERAAFSGWSAALLSVAASPDWIFVVRLKTRSFFRNLVDAAHLLDEV